MACSPTELAESLLHHHHDHHHHQCLLHTQCNTISIKTIIVRWASTFCVVYYEWAVLVGDKDGLQLLHFRAEHDNLLLETAIDTLHVFRLLLQVINPLFLLCSAPTGGCPVPLKELLTLHFWIFIIWLTASFPIP